MRLLVHDDKNVLVLKDSKGMYTLPNESFWPVHRKKPKAYLAARLFKSITFNLYSFDFKSLAVFGLEDRCMEHKLEHESQLESLRDTCNAVAKWMKHSRRPLGYTFRLVSKTDVDYKKLDVHTSLVFRVMNI